MCLLLRLRTQTEPRKVYTIYRSTSILIQLQIIQVDDGDGDDDNDSDGYYYYYYKTIYSWCIHSYETNSYQLVTILQKLKVKSKDKT